MIISVVAAILLISVPAWGDQDTQLRTETPTGTLATRSGAVGAAELVISLITVLPGRPAYSVFGHTALRVQDPGSGEDLLFDYGQSQVPLDASFVPRFLLGTMPFMVAVMDTPGGFDFWRRVEGRTILEQTLDLSQGQAQALNARLRWDARPENREYIYDFFFENCTTRIRDVLEEVLGKPLELPSERRGELTFRDEIRPYLEPRPLLNIGIMLILGPGADTVPTDREVLFLPVRLMEALGDAEIVSDSTESMPPRGVPIVALLAWTVFAFSVGVTFVRRAPPCAARLVDALLFTGSGLLGLLAVSLWAFSGYEPTYWNLNLLWAWPTHIIAPFAVRRMLNPESPVRLAVAYFRLSALASGVVVLSLPVATQVVPLDILPILVALSIRSAAVAHELSRRSRASVYAGRLH